MKCSNCGLSIVTPLDIGPYRCKFCHAALCSPDLHDCWKDHWKYRHSNQPRRVVEVKGP